MASEPMETINPTDNSLAAELRAFDLLSARLSRLTDQTRWSARIPLNSKATVPGQIVHTNDLKVHIGGDYYVEMTAKEAVDYVQRRKNTLLLQHAGLKENATTPSHLNQGGMMLGARSVSFNPLFSTPAEAGPSRVRAVKQPLDEDVISSSASKGKQPEVFDLVNESLSSPSQLSNPRSEKPKEDKEPQSLMDVVETFLQAQQGLSHVSDAQRDKLRGSSSDDALVTEEGLPIHEIREDFDGKLIGAAPEPTSNGEATVEARREALRKRIFSEDDDSDLEIENDDATEAHQDSIAQIDSHGPIEESDDLTRPIPSRRSSSSAPTPTRSILKTPARKKSVTFDESVPLPPDSPPRESGKMGFPLPQVEFEPRPVPVIAAPLPTPRSNSADTFAGFKRGFLSPSSGVVGPTHTSSPIPLEIPAGKSKGPSKFAQVMAAKKQAQAVGVIPEDEAEAQAVAINDDVKERNPPAGVSQTGPTSAVKDAVAERTVPMAGLPKFSESKPMGSMKNEVVEREPVAPVAPGASALRNRKATVDSDGDEGQDSDEYDEEEEYEEDEDEDEYDLDEALLAREVALDYHRRQGYITKYTRDVDSDGEEQDPTTYEVNSDGELEGHGGVLLGLPQIGTDGQIINPTPDDIRKYVRVGRLENGNLVLAPGEEGWSSDEDAEKKAKRDAVRRQLLGEALPDSQSIPTHVQPVTSSFSSSLPPKVETDNDPSPQKSKMSPVVSVGEVKERDPSATNALVEAPQPKKVSRFKAARMGA